MTDPTAEERAYLDEVERWIAEEGGYEHLQKTRPLTAAYGLNDSPLGLLAWLLEKDRAWSDRRDGHTGLSDDHVLIQASLYWFTGTIASSFRPYWEHRAFPPANGGRVAVPTALAVFPGDLVHPPRSWAERAYDLRRYTRLPRGGHFAAVEEPDLLATTSGRSSRHSPDPGGGAARPFRRGHADAVAMLASGGCTGALVDRGPLPVRPVSGARSARGIRRPGVRDGATFAVVGA